MDEAKLTLDTNLFRKDRTLAAYLAIALKAAREARLLHIIPTELEARSVIEPILRDHTSALKTAWLRQPNGGIRGWTMFLAKLGYRERLTVEPVSPADLVREFDAGRGADLAGDFGPGGALSRD